MKARIILVMFAGLWVDAAAFAQTKELNLETGEQIYITRLASDVMARQVKGSLNRRLVFSGLRSSRTSPIAMEVRAKRSSTGLQRFTKADLAGDGPRSCRLLTKP